MSDEDLTNDNFLEEIKKLCKRYKNIITHTFCDPYSLSNLKDALFEFMEREKEFMER